MHRVFLLSPANVAGLRARYLLNPQATFPLARAFHATGLPLGDVFTFASGLYFRGKLTYANAFAGATQSDSVWVMTSNRGLLKQLEPLRPHDLANFGTTPIDENDPLYTEPLRRDATRLRDRVPRDAQIVLLGSIATPKYRSVLLEVFEERLLFPIDFVGRGDMSRGALLLRAAQSGRELEYRPVHGALYTGKRAPRVSPVR